MSCHSEDDDYTDIIGTPYTAGAYIVCPIVWLIIDLYNNYVLWSNFVLTP